MPTINSSAATDKDLFEKLKQQLLSLDPVSFAEKYLTLDGKPFRLHGNGYRPFADIYRYIGIKALEPNSKPIIIVKGRQVGATTMASVLEMYFMGSGLFGVGDKPPIRIIHTFPQLELAAAYSKTKLNQMINSSVAINSDTDKKGAKPKTFMQTLLDQSTTTNDSLHFKQFIGGNHLWIESTGLDADRIMGRMLSLETDIPTINGFVKLKELKEGDQLFDENGNICTVTKLHPIDFNPESYKITFDDDTTIDACADHLWLTYTKSDRNKKRKPTVKNTKELFETLKKSGEANHSILCTKPLNYSDKNLLLDPYLLGLWLGNGDGNGRIESADPEIFNGYEYHVIKSSINHIGNFNSIPSKSCSYRIKGLTTKLRSLNLLVNGKNIEHNLYKKYIPEIYMKSSFNQRLALLQGLLDTDGHCDKNGNIEFVQVREDLAKQVYDLVLSLGIKAYFYKRDSKRYGKKYADKYRIRFITNLPVFRMKRKLDRIKNNISTKSTHRFITDIKKINPIPMRCITVDSPSHLFLVTKKYIATHNTADGIFFDEVQKTSDQAIGNALKILTTAKYGNKGIQVFFGTPRKKGSGFYKRWAMSTQQYYYLGCEKCGKHFPLYTPGSDDWEKIWITGFTVQCTHCNHQQDKRDAAERGKWISSRPESESDLIGFHINQLYMPFFTKEDIMNEKPGKHPVNTERVYQNEVLGEFFQGDSSPITPEEIRQFCADFGRKFRPKILPGEEQIVVVGIDYGARADLEQLADPEKSKGGQSYSTAVVLVAKGPGLLSIEFATKFKRNDPESKKGVIDQIMRQYSVNLAIGDIGYSNDFSIILHNSYGDKYLVSRAHPKVNGYVKFSADSFPKELVFERDYYIGELYEQMKKGMIRFPYGDYEKIAWLIDHCASMEIKPSISRGGDPTIHYVKGSTPNDGFMALLNAYIAYKFIITKGFTSNNPLNFQQSLKDQNKPLAITGYIKRRV
jgi:hypothetical protein